MSQQTLAQRKETQTPTSLPARPAFSPRSFGEQAPDQGAGHSLSRLSVLRPQAKLTVNQPGDKYEQEADAVADHVMRLAGPARPDFASSWSPLSAQRTIQRCACQDKEEAQRKESSRESGDGLASADVSGAVSEGLSGGGQALDGDTQAFMESRFGHDFSQVRVHTDARASQSTEQVAARAYTVGSDIAFRSGEYAPGSSEGRRLLAHELTHTIQQGGASCLPATKSGLVQREGDPEDQPQFPPDWQHGAPTKPDESDSHVAPDPNAPKPLPPSGPYRKDNPEAEGRVRDKIPSWILAIGGAVLVAGLIACFATGVCEFAAVVGALGFAAAAIVIGILKATGITDSGSSGATATASPDGQGDQQAA